jgi:O-succinylbenzoate synthase
MAKAAVEAAVLDAECRADGIPLVNRLGAIPRLVPAGVAVGLQPSIGELLELVGSYLAEGYRRVKLKIEPGNDVAPVRAVRERFGDDLMIQVDANQAYTLADAPLLKALDPFGLQLIEQPLPEDDLFGHARLAELIQTPVCLDESITSVRQAAEALALGACSVVNVKPARVGGLLEAVRIHDLCLARGVDLWCGGMLETGIGRAANLALAALPGFTLPGDLSASGRYFHRDLTEPFVLEEGCLRVPSGPGIGVAPLAEALAEFTTSRETLPL